MILAVATLVDFYRSRSSESHGILTLYGNVDIRQVDLGFRVQGRVNKMFFEEGDEVPAGALVATLEKQPYQDQVWLQKANLESIKASFEHAQLLYQRRVELRKSDSVSQEDLDDALSSQNVFKANLDQAKASLSIALQNLDYTEVYAPTDGFILTRIREPGTAVRETDPVYTLSIKTPVWVRAYIDEPHLGLIYNGMDVEIITDAKNGKVYKGKIGFISPVAEFTPKTVETTQLRTDLVFRLRAYAENPDHGLRQGMPVTLKLKLHSKESVPNFPNHEPEKK